MTDWLLWIIVIGGFILWAQWHHIRAFKLHRQIRRDRDAARERSKRIHPSNRD